MTDDNSLASKITEQVRKELGYIGHTEKLGELAAKVAEEWFNSKEVIQFYEKRQDHLELGNAQRSKKIRGQRSEIKKHLKSIEALEKENNELKEINQRNWNINVEQRDELDIARAVVEASKSIPKELLTPIFLRTALDAYDQFIEEKQND